MELSEFKNKAEVTEFNNCNGWGFGGSYGKYFTLGIFKYRQSKYSSRHQGTWKSDAYFIEGKYEVEKKEFINELAKLTTS